MTVPRISRRGGQGGEPRNAGHQPAERTEREQERIHARLQLEGAAEAVDDGDLVAVGDAEAADRALNDGMTKQQRKDKR